MKINLKNYKTKNLILALRDLANPQNILKLKMNDIRKIAKTINLLTEEYQAIDKRQKELIKVYGAYDEKGDLITYPNGTFKYKKDTREEGQKKMEDCFDIEVEIPFSPIESAFIEKEKINIKIESWEALDDIFIF